MKFTQDVINDIVALAQQNLASRRIASELGISKSAVNNYLSKLKTASTSSPVTKKYLFLDIETMPTVAAVFGRFKQNIGQDNVLSEGGWVVSIAWRWAHESQAQGMILNPDEIDNEDDTRLVKKLSDLINEADVIIAHNIDGYDLPVIKSRLVVNKLPPLKKVKTIDTLKIAKQMRFNSNKLDSLGEVLGEGRKVNTGGINLWIGCLFGVAEDLETMLEYNLEDVDLLHRVYNRLQPHNNKSVNAGLFTDKTVCPNCGSNDIMLSGSQHTNQSTFDEYTCNDCGANSRSKKTKKRVSLVV